MYEKFLVCSLVSRVFISVTLTESSFTESRAKIGSGLSIIECREDYYIRTVVLKCCTYSYNTSIWLIGVILTRNSALLQEVSRGTVILFAKRRMVTTLQVSDHR